MPRNLSVRFYARASDLARCQKCSKRLIHWVLVYPSGSQYRLTGCPRAWTDPEGGHTAYLLDEPPA